MRDGVRKMYMDAWTDIAEATHKIVERNVNLQMDAPLDNELHYSGMAAKRLNDAQKYIAAALSVAVGLSDEEIADILDISVASSGETRE